MAHRALVTGAGGFVGANLCRRLLESGHSVHALVRPKADLWRLLDLRGEIALHELDLREGQAVRAVLDNSRPEWLFHLAAYGAYGWQRGIEQTFTTNAVVSAKLLEVACVRGFAAFIQSGSAAEYGFKDHPAKESERIEPVGAYAVSKGAATLYARAVSQHRDVHVVTLRLCSTYGPWEDASRLMPRLSLFGLQRQLPPLADPDTTLDFVFVDDVCDAFIRAAEADYLQRGSILNVGSGTETSLRELVELVRKAFAIEEQPRWSTLSTRTPDTTAWRADCTRVRTVLPWQPRWSLDQGLLKLADWLRDDELVRMRYVRRSGLVAGRDTSSFRVALARPLR